MPYSISVNKRSVAQDRQQMQVLFPWKQLMMHGKKMMVNIECQILYEDSIDFTLPAFSLSLLGFCIKIKQSWQNLNYCVDYIFLLRWVLGLCCFTPLSTIFQLYRGGRFYCWRKPVVPGENHRHVASHWQTLSHNVVSSTPRLSGIQTLNLSGDRHWLHR